MMEQTGEEIDWEKCPPDTEDFPDCVHDALSIYNSLGNRVFQDVGFVGKDFTNYKMLLELYGIEKYQIDWITQIMFFLENRDVIASQKAIKAAYDKMKR